jgi:hypothetical protein
MYSNELKQIKLQGIGKIFYHGTIEEPLLFPILHPEKVYHVRFGCFRIIKVMNTSMVNLVSKPQ